MACNQSHDHDTRAYLAAILLRKAGIATIMPVAAAVIAAAIPGAIVLMFTKLRRLATELF
jgi:hypothetical protein